MQFVENGPHIPERLLQLHEDGNLVFFCGAGISMSAGLPSFKGLVDHLYGTLKPEPSPTQDAAIRSKQYDTAIYLLEEDVAGGRKLVRETASKKLTPPDEKPVAIHQSLLELSKNNKGQTKLVTTNFDRLFEFSRGAVELPTCEAPLLLMPNERWDALVYLHGRLPESPEEEQLNKLVLSSGDFGKAYLTERWASRFVTELFRRYSVCFIGYSISDPVLRYMMDALAADRSPGEKGNEMFALGSYSKGGKGRAELTWRTKNVTPILYKAHKRHFYLRETLARWSKTYRDGLRGKEQIVAGASRLPPQQSTKQDDFIGRVLWAISDRSGLPAKAFADTTPAPSLEWLKEFSAQRFSHEDLKNFGVCADFKQKPKNFTFSLIERPSQGIDCDQRLVSGEGQNFKGLDTISWNLGKWLTRHLNAPDLVYWISENGGHIHPAFARQISDMLTLTHKLESNPNKQKLESYFQKYPDGVPTIAMRKMWNLILNGRLCTNSGSIIIFDLMDRIRKGAFIFDSNGREVIRNSLRPLISLNRPYSFTRNVKQATEAPTDPSVIFRLEVVFQSSDTHTVISQLKDDARWLEALPDLLSSFTSLLLDALELMSDMGIADGRNDTSWLDMPSISPHKQNKVINEWVTLIELCRDAWDVTLEIEPERAVSVARQWNYFRFLSFKRLALYAAAKTDQIPAAEAISWLLKEEAHLLWSNECKREAIRLIIDLSLRSSKEDFKEVEAALLKGPPRDLYKKDISEGRFRDAVDRSIWLRLAKINAEGHLTESAKLILKQIEKRHPNWKLSHDERDEFNMWTESGSELDLYKSRRILPRKCKEIINYLEEHPGENDKFEEEDDWTTRVRKDPRRIIAVLLHTARKGLWYNKRWSTALLEWRSDEKQLNVSWRYLSKVIAGAPDEFYQEAWSALSYWIEAKADNVRMHQNLFFEICSRMIDCSYDERDLNEFEDIYSTAINHPVGHAYQALMKWLFRCNELNDNMGLPREVQQLFTKAFTSTKESLLFGRVILYSHSIPLFRIDPEWTNSSLIRNGFDWKLDKKEAQASWVGFMQASRIHRPFLDRIKHHFFYTTLNIEALGRYQNIFVEFLTYLMLLDRELFTYAEYREMLSNLPTSKLPNVSSTIGRAIKAADEKREEYWDHRILPFYSYIWPKTKYEESDKAAHGWINVCVYSGEAFPRAVKKLESCLHQQKHLGMIFDSMLKFNHPTNFPEESLRLLNLVVGDQNSYFNRKKLGQMLDAIKESDRKLAYHPSFKRLERIYRI